MTSRNVWVKCLHKGATQVSYTENPCPRLSGHPECIKGPTFIRCAAKDTLSHGRSKTTTLSTAVMLPPGNEEIGQEQSEWGSNLERNEIC